MRRDNDLWRDAAIRPSMFAHIRDQCVQHIQRRRIKHSRDLRRVDGLRIAQRRGQGCYSAIISPEPPNSLGKSLSFGNPSLIGRTVS
jgi:hypothetical protein